MPLSHSDNDAIRQVVNQYTASVSDPKHKASGQSVASYATHAVASAFADTDKSIFVGPAGISVGHDAIGTRLAEMQADRFADAQFHTHIDNVQQVASDVAIVAAKSTINGVKRKSGEKLPPLESNSLLTLIKKDGAWKIAAHAVAYQHHSP